MGGGIHSANTASKARRKLLGLRHIFPSFHFGKTSFKPGTLFDICPPGKERMRATAGYAVLSSEYTDLRDSVEIKGGDVGSKVYIEAGCDVVVKGSLFSGRGMFLRERAHIYNDAAAVEEIREQNGIVVDGSKRSYAQLQIPSINLIPVTPGTRDTSVPNDGFCILPPGNYRDFHAYSRSTITFEPGNYVFNQFIIEPDVTIILKVADNERIEGSAS